MRFPRASGILLHPTSLSGRFGIGDLGAEAVRFADFLADAGQTIWQVLPLNPTGYGDSPYQCFSAFAGNPLLISLEALAKKGLLASADLEVTPPFPLERVDYGLVIQFKLPLLELAALNFQTSAPPSEREEFARFCQANASWLDDYALFMALKDAHRGTVWTTWPREVARRQPAALAQWSEKLAPEIAKRKYWQFEFYRQWHELKDYCHGRGIRVMGDIPIYVAHDSADVWGHRDLFCLDQAGNPTEVSGVPPDYFSATGQLWGNPIYRWEALARSGYQWWIERFRVSLDKLDMLRLDHFRGFEAYWEVPAGEPTAINGQWVKGPSADFFYAVQKALGDLPIVAENLGMITPEVEELRNRFGFPGMSILQFAFGTDPQAPGFRPHNYPRALVAYSGTHDNDTTMGWWTASGAGDSTRSEENVRKEREIAKAYLAFEDEPVNWVFIRTLMASVAGTVLFPLQDVLGLGNEARMNLPGRPAGNWTWRFREDALKPELAARLKRMTELYER